MTRVVLARTARDTLAQLDYLLADAVIDALGVLERDPTAGYTLRGRLTGLWSYPVGVYRIIYQFRDDKTVRVVAIRHRAGPTTRSPLGGSSADPRPGGLRPRDRERLGLDVRQG